MSQIGRASGSVNRLLRPESVRHMSVTAATQRLTAAHHETQRHNNKKARKTGKTQLTGYLRVDGSLERTVAGRSIPAQPPTAHCSEDALRVGEVYASGRIR